MNDQQLGLLIDSWLKESDCPPSDVGRSTAQVESRLPQTPQQRTWIPVSLPAQHTLWSTTRSIVAISIVALFGGFLLFGVLTGPEADEAVPATVPEGSAFPTGTFVADGDGLVLELRADGTCDRAGIPCKFGVVGEFFAEMAFEDPAVTQVPVSYRWDFDDDQLTFERYGVDKRPDWPDFYANHVFRPVGETLPLPDTPTDIPTGYFVSEGVGNVAHWSDGTTDYGRYAVNGNLLTYATNASSTVDPFPATYYWDWDGTELTFSLWGEDDNAWRRDGHGRVWVRDEEASEWIGYRALMLSDLRLDIWVRVELAERDDGRHKATATVDGEPLGEGVGDTVPEAVRAALEPLGEPYASDLADSVEG